MSQFGIALVILVAGALALPHGSNRRSDDAAKIYAGKCAACHGPAGAGNGAAAAAFNPKPTDFTSAEFQKAATDEQLATAIKDGKGEMPAFGKELSAADIKALVVYIRSLGPH